MTDQTRAVPDLCAVIDQSYCPGCGCYMPMRLNGTSRVDCGCERNPPMLDAPINIYFCPSCGRSASGRWGCWGTPERPHEHVYCVQVYEEWKAGRFHLAALDEKDACSWAGRAHEAGCTCHVEKDGG